MTITLLGAGPPTYAAAQPGPTPQVTSPDSITIEYDYGSGNFTAVLYDSTGTIPLESQSSTGAGSFTVPSGDYEVGIIAGFVGAKVPVTTAAVVAGGSAAVPQPLHFYAFGESSAGNRSDTGSGSAITLTQYGTVGAAAGYRLASAANFDGTAANYLQGASLPVNFLAGAKTFAFWIKFSASGNLFAFGDASPTCLYLYLDGIGRVVFNRPGVNNWTADGNTPNTGDGNWHHVAITVTIGSPNTYTAYLDGELWFSKTDATALSSFAGIPFRVGTANGNFIQNGAFSIQDLAFFDRALSAAEVRALPLLGTPHVYPYTGILYPTSAVRTALVARLYVGGPQAVYLPGPGDDDGILRIPDWPADRLVRCPTGTSGGVVVAPSGLSVTDLRAAQAVVGLSGVPASGTVYVTDGERWCRATAFDPATAITSAESTEFKARIIATIDAMRHPADPAPSNLPYGYFFPGSHYPYGQFSWDTWWAVVLMSAFDATYRGYAKNWLKSFAQHIKAPGDPAGLDGQTPFYVVNSDNPTTPGAVNYGPQAWCFGWAAWKMYEADGDSTWLGDIYSWLKAGAGYYETVNKDATGLYSISATTGGGTNIELFLARTRADLDGTCNDRLFMSPYAYPPDSANTFRTDHCDPELSALLVKNSESMASIATLLGHSSDATAYTALAAAIAAAMQTWMWDEAQLRWQWVERSELVRSIGTASAASPGATSVTLTSATTKWLPAGCKIVLPGGVVCQPAAAVELVANVATAIPLTSPLAGAVASGATVYHNFAEVDNLGMQVAPLFAGVTTQAQAEAVRDRVFHEFDGITPESWQCWFGSSLRNNRALRFEWVHWSPKEQSGTSFSPTSLDIPSGTVGLKCAYRRTDSGNFVYAVDFLNENYDGDPYQFHNPEWERVDENRPLTVTVEWVRNGAAAPLVRYRDADLNVVDATTLAVPAGSDGTPVSATATFTTRSLPGIIEVEGAGGATLKVRSVLITTRPYGWAYKIPQGGLIAQPRVSRVPASKPLLRTLDYQDGSWRSVSYWNGDSWAPQNYWASVGMNDYGLTADAETLTRHLFWQNLLETRVWNVARGSEQGVWERMDSNGATTGSPNYPWGGLPWLAAVELGICPA